MIRIDDALWNAASRLRRDDWRATIAEVLREPWLEKQNATLSVSALAGGVALELRDAATNTVRAHHTVSRESLRPLMDEYLNVIRRMTSEEVADSSSLMQALDMAKKVVHDKGARTLAREAPDLAPDHESYRMLFTLLLTLLVDVTVLPGVRPHRRHV